MMLYHKFILYNKHTKFPSTEAIAACILVASKLEDTPKRGREIVAATHIARGRELKGSALDEARSQAVALERQILETVGFDFRIRYPHMYVVKICKERKIDRAVASMAWTIASDSYVTDAVLKIPPHTVALACIILAAKLKDVNIFPVDSDALESPRLNVNVALIDLLDFYIENHRETPLFKEYGDVEMESFLSLREKVGKEMSARASSLPCGDDINPAVEVRDPRLSDKGAVRYVLEWEKGHLLQELKNGS
jgi:CTD kinase subunit beta